MDSSTSQHSQEQPPSSSYSQPSSASDSDYPSDNGYDGSAEGTLPERPSENSSTTSMQWKTSAGDQPEEEDEDMINVNTIDSARMGKQIDSAIASSSREGKPEEIGLLTDLYTLRNKTGRYLLSGENDQRDFYKFWIEEERDYASKKELDDKIGELHARFLKNMDKDVEGPTNAVDAEILRISHWLWGSEIESCDDDDDQDDDDGDDHEQDCKDLSGANAGDEGANHGDDDVDGDDQEQDCKDLSDANAGDEGVNQDDNDDDDQDETEDEVWGGDDLMDSKDSTNGSDPMDKD